MVLVPQKHFLLIKLHKSISSLFNLILTFIINKLTTEQCKKRSKSGATTPRKRGQGKFAGLIPAPYCLAARPEASCGTRSVHGHGTQKTRPKPHSLCCTRSISAEDQVGNPLLALILVVKWRLNPLFSHITPIGSHLYHEYRGRSNSFFFSFLVKYKTFGHKYLHIVV